MRLYTLIANLVLLLLTTTSFLYNLSAQLAPLGLLLGALLALPGLLALLHPGLLGSGGDRLLLRINTWAIVALTAGMFAIMYLLLSRDSSDQLALTHMISLVCAMGLCANSLLMLGNLQQHSQTTSNDLVHRAMGGPSIWLLLALALVATDMALALVAAMGDMGQTMASLKAKLIERGIIPFLTIAMFFWGLFLLLGNYLLVKNESRRLLEVQDNSLLAQAFTLHCSLVRRAGKEWQREQLQDFMDSLWSKVNYFYTLPRYINWAIPILGFIGTVFGISLAAESIGQLISSNDTGFGSALGDAVAPLGIAFDTTLVALTLSVVLMLVQALSQRWQERQLHAVEQKLRGHNQGKAS